MTNEQETYSLTEVTAPAGPCWEGEGTAGFEEHLERNSVPTTTRPQAPSTSGAHPCLAPPPCFLLLPKFGLVHPGWGESTVASPQDDAEILDSTGLGSQELRVRMTLPQLSGLWSVHTWWDCTRSPQEPGQRSTHSMCV